LILIQFLILKALGGTPHRRQTAARAFRWLSFLLFPLLTSCSGWTVMPMVIDLETGEIPFGEQTGITCHADPTCPAKDERFLNALAELDATSFRDRMLAAQTLAACGERVLPYLDRAVAAAVPGSHRHDQLLSILQRAMERIPGDTLARELHHASMGRRRAAVRALCQRGPTSVPVLLTCIRDHDVEIRRIAVTGLRTLTGLHPAQGGANLTWALHRWQQWAVRHARPTAGNDQLVCQITRVRPDVGSP
jgi:hypothetical protein